MKKQESSNELGITLDAAQAKAQYDSNVKHILSDKYVLAHILRACCKEMAHFSVDELVTFIEGDPLVGKVSVKPGETNLTITGMNIENDIQGEGRITFDILFFVRLPEGGKKKFIINVEAQKDYYPGYPLETRAVFYGARALSAQMGREFTEPHYDRIKKVYSIWICPNSPKGEGNTITAYSIEQRNVFGNHKKSDFHDLLEVILVGLNENKADAAQIHKMLNTLLSDTKTPVEKKVILEHDFGIPISRKLEKEMMNMCNLSDLIEQKGHAEGHAEGRTEVLINLLKAGAEKTLLLNAGFSEEDIRKAEQKVYTLN